MKYLLILLLLAMVQSQIHYFGYMVNYKWKTCGKYNADCGTNQYCVVRVLNTEPIQPTKSNLTVQQLVDMYKADK